MTMTIYARLDVTFIGLMMARTEVHHIEIQAPNLPLFDTVEVATAKAKIASVISDVLGKSGQAILNALVAGETNPENCSRCAAVA